MYSGVLCTLRVGGRGKRGKYLYIKQRSRIARIERNEAQRDFRFLARFNNASANSKFKCVFDTFLAATIPRASTSSNSNIKTDRYTNTR